MAKNTYNDESIQILEGLEVIDEIATCEKISLNPMFTDVPMDAAIIKTIRIDK